MSRTLFVTTLLATSFLAVSQAGQFVPTDAERARWTMGDMRSWSIVLSAYQKDNNRFPTAENLEELIAQIQPIYIRVAPVRDAWGNPYRYQVSEQGLSCSLASAGSDGVFEPGQPEEEKRLADFSEDAVVKDGEFLRVWKYR